MSAEVQSACRTSEGTLYTRVRMSWTWNSDLGVKGCYNFRGRDFLQRVHGMQLMVSLHTTFP